MKGNIIKISRFCTDDGPGIRTVVFLKGCPLNCIWCHNPESQRYAAEIMYDSKKCVNCKRCYKVCNKGCHTLDEHTHTFHSEKCNVCGECIAVCQAKAIEVVGKKVDPILEKVESIGDDLMDANSSFQDQLGKALGNIMAFDPLAAQRKARNRAMGMGEDD